LLLFVQLVRVTNLVHSTKFVYKSALQFKEQDVYSWMLQPPHLKENCIADAYYGHLTNEMKALNN
jgi:hypothetical protein